MSTPAPPSPADLPPAATASPALQEMLRADDGQIYRRLVESVHDYAIFFLTPQGHIASWNPGAQRIKGWQADEIIGRHFSTFYTDDALERGWPAEELRRAAADGRLEDEGWRLRKDGSRFWANVVITALRGSQGELLGYAKVTRDLTERRAQEERLRESERNLRLMVTTVIDYAIYSMDPSGVITGWNLGAERIKGYRANEAIGRHFSLFYLPEDVARGLPQRALARAAEASHFEAEGWRVRKDGSRLWASVTVTAIRDESGELIGFSKVTRDLTERRRHEEALREREENLRLLVEGVKDHAMYLLDPAGRIRTWNSGAQLVLGHAAEAVLEQDVAMLYCAEERSAGRPASDLASARAAGFFRAEGWRLRADGTRFWADVATTHLTEGDGRTRGYVQIVRDLTERQRVEMLETEGRRIAEFIAMLSHELRNPLAPISNAITLLKGLVAHPQAAWAVELLARQTAHLTRLVDDLLDVSRISRGKIPLEPVALDFNALVRQAVDAAAATVSAHGHALALQLAPQPLPVQGDPTRLTQVIVNLLNNAAKYTPSGGRIDVSLQAEGGVAVLQVADTGIGMDASLLQRAFDPFVQGARALDRAEGGLGIGLTLVRNIVELHGGSVAVASPGPGKGTTFTVTLPLSRQPAAPGAAPAAAASAGPAPADAPVEADPHARRVLIVDDNEDAAQTLAELLRLKGHEVQVAHDGAQALSMAAAMRPQVAVLDIGLPGMDGYEVARRLRGLPALGSVRLVALTGYGQHGDRQTALDAGFASHFTKPVDPEALALALV
jgi:PAS domain S-box-containing protein